jgi:hypothetical protein
MQKVVAIVASWFVMFQMEFKTKQKWKGNGFHQQCP